MLNTHTILDYTQAVHMVAVRLSLEAVNIYTSLRVVLLFLTEVANIHTSLTHTLAAHFIKAVNAHIILAHIHAILILLCLHTTLVRVQVIHIPLAYTLITLEPFPSVLVRFHFTAVARNPNTRISLHIIPEHFRIAPVGFHSTPMNLYGMVVPNGITQDPTITLVAPPEHAHAALVHVVQVASVLQVVHPLLLHHVLLYSKLPERLADERKYR